MKRILSFVAILAIIALGVSLYHGVAQAPPGVSQMPSAPPSIEVASYNATAQTANLSATAFFTAQAPNALGVAPYSLGAGKYRFVCYEVQTATGTSSVIPSCGVSWTDNETGVAESVAAVAATNSANSVGAFTQGSEIIDIKAGSVVNVTTAGGTYAGMTYNIHAAIEYLGN